ncbi:hypothetical protein HDU93_003172 [Gonapodya sp. JEL0774]|nr:hypothetical protein HDU93_003172 [Gonapodya sp. JEL0774]
MQRLNNKDASTTHLKSSKVKTSGDNMGDAGKENNQFSWEIASAGSSSFPTALSTPQQNTQNPRGLTLSSQQTVSSALSAVGGSNNVIRSIQQTTNWQSTASLMHNQDESLYQQEDPLGMNRLCSLPETSWNVIGFGLGAFMWTTALSIYLKVREQTPDVECIYNSQIGDEETVSPSLCPTFDSTIQEPAPGRPVQINEIPPKLLVSSNLGKLPPVMPANVLMMDRNIFVEQTPTMQFGEQEDEDDTVRKSSRGKRKIPLEVLKSRHPTIWENADQIQKLAAEFVLFKNPSPEHIAHHSDEDSDMLFAEMSILQRATAHTKTTLPPSVALAAFMLIRRDLETKPNHLVAVVKEKGSVWFSVAYQDLSAPKQAGVNELPQRSRDLLSRVENIPRFLLDDEERPFLNPQFLRMVRSVMPTCNVNSMDRTDEELSVIMASVAVIFKNSLNRNGFNLSKDAQIARDWKTYETFLRTKFLQDPESRATVRDMIYPSTGTGIKREAENSADVNEEEGLDRLFYAKKPRTD